MFDETYIRQRLKQRYNRRFFVAAHVVLLLGLIVAGFLLPAIREFLAPPVFLLLLPHLLYVAYHEYRDWVEQRIDRELYGHNQDGLPDKRKRYSDSHLDDTPAFRLTDDGEIEPISGEKKAKRGDDRSSPPVRTTHRRNDDDDDNRRNMKSRRRGRKDDTDEWDVKRLLKKIKDILD